MVQRIFLVRTGTGTADGASPRSSAGRGVTSAAEEGVNHRGTEAQRKRREVFKEKSISWCDAQKPSHRHPGRVALLPSPQGSGTLRLLGALWRREIDKIKKEKSNQLRISVIE